MTVLTSGRLLILKETKVSLMEVLRTGLKLWVPLLLLSSAAICSGQDKPATSPVTDPPKAAVDIPPTPAKVEVLPLTEDVDIARRLTNIMSTTEWYTNPRAEVNEGVVFLYGTTTTQNYKDWASDLARNTQDVAAVVNRINVTESSVWDMSPVQAEIAGMSRRALLSLPYFLLGLIILAGAMWVARVSVGASRKILETHYETPFLREVLAKATGFLVFLLGLYFVLRIYGLTRLAVTVLGGTGLFGLILGIAFRDITENFLASILLSLQNPFRPGDLVLITGETGYVQSLNARTTVLLTLDGNTVQIPNATVYKSSITNLMINPNRRESFMISISYGDSIADAQAHAMQVLHDHPAVLEDPEPWVLVDSLTPELVTLKIYYWLNARDHSILKVRSSLIRLIKVAFQEHGIQLPAAPGAALAVSQLAQQPVKLPPSNAARRKPAGESRREGHAVTTEAEAGLESEEKLLLSQAHNTRRPEDGENLLTHSPAENQQVPEFDDQTDETDESTLVRSKQMESTRH